MKQLKLRSLFMSVLIMVISVTLFTSCKTADVPDIEYEGTLGSFLLNTSLAFEKVSSNYLFFNDEREAQVIEGTEAIRLLNEALENNLIISDDHLTATLELLKLENCIAVYIQGIEIVDDSLGSESEEKHIADFIVIPSPAKSKTDIATFKNATSTIYKVKDNRTNTDNPKDPCWYGMRETEEGCYCDYWNPGWRWCNDCDIECKDGDDDKLLDMCKNNPDCGIDKFLDKNPLSILKPNIWITPEFITPKI